MIKRPTKRNATRALSYVRKYWDAHDDIINAHLMLHMQCDEHRRNKAQCQIGEQALCPYTCVAGDGWFSTGEWIEAWEQDGMSIVQGLDGFRMLGSGSYRTAILGPDGYVYKVGDEDHNRNEYEAYHALSQRIADEAFKVAECTLFEVRKDVVSAMPLVKTIASCLDWGWQTETINDFVINRMKQFIDDIHEENWGVDEDGWIVVFDYGFSDSNGEKTTMW